MVEAPKFYPFVAYYSLLEMLVNALNAILFSLLSFLCLRDYRRRKTRWGGYIFVWTLVACAVLFLTHLGNDFAEGLLRRRMALFDVLGIASKYMLFPLVLHLFYRNDQDRLPKPWIWQVCIAIFYSVSVAFMALALNVAAFGWFAGRPGWERADFYFHCLGTLAAGGTILILWLGRRPEPTPFYSRQHRWLTLVSAAWLVVFALGIVHPTVWSNGAEKLVSLAFILILTFYVEQITFFDVLIKRGAFIFASLFLLTMYFALAPPFLLRLQFTNWFGTLIWGLTVWPIVVLAPWGHRKLSAWLDRLWLGRRFSPAQATKHFLAGLEGAISEDELCRRAGDHLAAIFRSEAEVVLGPPRARESVTETDVMIADVRLSGRVVGEMRVKASENHPPFLSEDIALLGSLADALAFLLENLRLREERLLHERTQQELLLEAKRAELKALRAQINPHFLFNALNTIAGLIPRHPDRAEETIEELAEVFRYTLRRSEREWVPMQEELEAVRAYLRIEQARFGESLQFAIHVEGGDSSEVRIPAMMIQTLVENAVKHGLAALTGPGLVEVGVFVSSSQVRIEVRDNGSGFQEAAARSRGGAETGYGLRNIRERLQRYFGSAGRLGIARDLAREMTLVTIEMPRTAQAFGAAGS